MVKKFKFDSASDIVHLYRIPTTVNHKYATPQEVSEPKGDGVVYRRQDIFEILEYDMWGQTLGAIISLDKVTIYCGDEEYPDDYLGFDQFKIILSNWYDFLLSEPNISNEVYFSV